MLGHGWQQSLVAILSACLDLLSSAASFKTLRCFVATAQRTSHGLSEALTLVDVGSSSHASPSKLVVRTTSSGLAPFHMSRRSSRICRRRRCSCVCMTWTASIQVRTFNLILAKTRKEAARKRYAEAAAQLSSCEVAVVEDPESGDIRRERERRQVVNRIHGRLA